MKITRFISAILLILLVACGEQNSKKNPSNVSKLDISKEHPAYSNAEELNKRPSPPMSKVLEGQDGVGMAVHYSSPRVKEREIWGELVPYNEIWRTGANEATVLHFKEDVVINGERIPEGKYGLFTIPQKDNWTIIINKNYDQWGAYDYKKSQDLLRFDVPVNESEFKENFQIDLNAQDANNTELVIAWEKVSISFKISEAEKNS